MLHVRICAGGAGPTSVPTATKPIRSTKRHEASTKKTLNSSRFMEFRGSFPWSLPLPTGNEGLWEPIYEMQR
jgi:hypothetical protein